MENATAMKTQPAAAGDAKPINKVALVLLTFFLGGLGIHKFYLGKTGQGILYLVFCWTMIPGLIAFIEFIIYAVSSEEKLAAKFGRPVT